MAGPVGGGGNTFAGYRHTELIETMITVINTENNVIVVSLELYYVRR